MRSRAGCRSRRRCVRDDDARWIRRSHRTTPDTPALALNDARKRFGAVIALDDISLDVHHGEVLALLGDNGAGKSTLIKCLSGVHRLDSGSIEMDGVPVSDPRAV